MSREFTAMWVLALMAALATTPDPAGPSLADGFRHVPPESRMRMYWHVFGPAWTREGIDYQLDLLKAAGVGGVMTIFFYPVATDDPEAGVTNLPLLSPQNLAMIGYTASAAHKRGLRFGISGGSGWPFGGPSVTPADAAQRIQRIPAAAGTGFSYPAGPAGMRVKRPALGGEGLVVDHYRREALVRYLESVVAPMVGAAPPGLIQSIFCDSLEVYNANWTAAMQLEFKRRRGYDLMPLLAALFDSADPHSPDVRFDFWRTLAELMEEEFTESTSHWAHEHNVQLEMEAYGTPPNPLTAARYIDVPTGEQYEWKGFSFSRFAASGAHLCGKRVIGAEAWTWLGLPNRLADSLADFKMASDMHFLAGINDLTGVSFPYSPRSAGNPGWLPYFGPVMNQNNPQWPMFHYLVEYVNRCQWMLRQGRPVADVAVYLPVEQIFAHGPVEQQLLDFHVRDHFVTGELTDEFSLKAAFKHESALLHGLLQAGFQFDGIDLWAMERLARVEAGRLVCGDGRYRILVLPNLEGMDLPALEKVAAFCRSGGTVIATRRLPSRTYGGTQSTADSGRLAALVAEMFGPVPPAAISEHAYGGGRAIFLPDERASLASVLSGLQPDLRIESRSSNVTFAHRSDGRRDIYFLVNMGDSWAREQVGFRDASGSGKRVTAGVWDPLTGGMREERAVRLQDGYVLLSVNLPPHGSTFVVFGELPDWTDETPSEGPPQRTFARTSNPEWHVTFDGPDAPAPLTTRELRSWTEWPGGRNFSGRATYTARFDWEGPIPQTAELTLGAVHEAAEVRLNGRLVGAIWLPDQSLEVRKFLRRGRNTISVTVANLMVNRFIGQPDQDLGPLRAAYGNRFPAPEEKQLVKEPLPAGLLGPVKLISESPR